MLEYKLWIVFFFLAAIHVVSCFLNFYKIRVATKPLLLIFLSVIYATSASVFRPLVFTALLLGFAGDTLLLLGDEKKGIAIVKNDVYLKFAKAIFKAQEESEEE